MTSVSDVLENNGLRHVLGLILSYLDPESVKMASQVSRLWYDVLHTPSTYSREAWKWAKLFISGSCSSSSSRVSEQENLLVRSRKPAVIPVIRIFLGSKLMVESVLRAACEGYLEELELCWIPNTTDVALLSQAIRNVPVFKIYCGLCGLLDEAIRGALLEGPDFTLKSLLLCGNPGVSADILARVAVMLNTLDVGGVTSAQFGEILTRLAVTEDSKLRVLNLRGSSDRIDISHISPEILTDALLKLETADIFDNVILPPGHISQLMTKIRDSEDARLTKLDLWDFDISQVAPDVLAEAVSKLETVAIRVTPPQALAVFSRLQYGGFRLKSLELHREVDLSGVTTKVLLRVLRKLEQVQLFGPTFTTSHVAAIITMLSEESQGKLKKLHIIYPMEEPTEAYELLVDVAANDMANDILEMEL